MKTNNHTAAPLPPPIAYRLTIRKLLVLPAALYLSRDQLAHFDKAVRMLADLCRELERVHGLDWLPLIADSGGPLRYVLTKGRGTFLEVWQELNPDKRATEEEAAAFEECALMLSYIVQDLDDACENIYPLDTREERAERLKYLPI